MNGKEGEKVYLFVELLSDAFGPLEVDVVRLARSVDVGQFDAHLHGEQSIRFVGPIDAGRIGVVDFGVELGDDFKVAFEIGGQNGLDDQVAESFELAALQVHQEVEARVRQEELPRCSRVMVLQLSYIYIYILDIYMYTC